MSPSMRPRFASACVAVAVPLALLLTPIGQNSVARGATSGPIAGIGLIRTAANNWSTLTNTDKYSIIVAGNANEDAAGAQPGLALGWGCGVNIPKATWAAECGISWDDAVANNWILKDASGNYVPYGDGYSYLADIGNPSFQQRWISDMDADLRKHPGIDGVFIDNIQGSLFNASPKYPTNASYRAAMLSFISTVGPAMQTRGWYVDVNASIYDPDCTTCGGPTWDASEPIWWFTQIAPYVDGINMEHWQQNWSDGSVRLAGTSVGTLEWDGFQRIPGAVQSLGTDFYAMDVGAMSDTRKMTYLKASFLLDWNGGHSAFLYTDDYGGTSDPWNPAWTLDVGQPKGAKYQIGAGWRRDFASGTVLIDPSPSTSQTFALNGAYLLSDGSAPSSVTLSPGTAMILRANASASAPPPTTTTTTTTTTSTTTPIVTTAPEPTTTTSTTSTTTPTTTTTTTTTTPPSAPSPTPPTNTKPPAVTGPSLVGKTAKASQGDWSGSPTSFAFQWFRCNASGAQCVAITGANGATYDMVAADEGATLVVSVVASNAAGTASASSPPTAVVKKTGNK